MVDVAESFALALEKRAAVYTTRDLEARLSRKKAEDDLKDLQGSRSPGAYVKGAVGGAVAGGALPSIMRISGYLGSTDERLEEVSRRAREQRMANLAKSMGFKNPESVGRGLARYLEGQGQTEAMADSISAIRAKALVDHALGASRGEHPLNEGLVAEFESRAQNPVHAFMPERADSASEAAQVTQDRLQAHLTAMRTAGGVGAKENSHLWQLAERAGKVDEKAIGRQMVGEELGRAAKGAAPFAVLGAITGLMAVRAKRKKLQEVERG